MAEVIAAYKQDANVEYVEPNFTYHKDDLPPNDPYFSNLWGLNNEGQDINGSNGLPGADANVLKAWELTTGSEDVVVGVIDTGIDYSHPDLSPNIWVNEGEIPNNGIDDDGNGVIDDIHGYNAINDNGR